MVKRLVLCALALCGAGCSPEIITRVETVEVRVPVPVRAEPPPELQQPYAPGNAMLPAFVTPDDPAATVALTKEGAGKLKLLLLDLLGRVRAWEVWAPTGLHQFPTDRSTSSIHGGRK